MPSINIGRERSLYARSSERHTPAIRRDLARLREQMSTGLRINRPSDDAAGYAQARKLGALSSRRAQYQRSIGAARPWVDQTQDALDGLADLFTEAYESGLRAANDARSDDDREVIAQRLDALKGEVVDGLNAESAGEHLFAGNRTDAPPFYPNGNVAGAYGNFKGERERQIGPDQRIVLNISAERVHQTGEGFSITEALDALTTAVRDGDQGAMQGAIGQVETARDHLADLGAAAGTTAERLTRAAEQLRTADVVTERQRSALEDADYLDVLTRVQQRQGHLEAALKVTSSTLQTSLLDYLR